jgi:hypothetical protein
MDRLGNALEEAIIPFIAQTISAYGSISGGGGPSTETPQLIVGPVSTTPTAVRSLRQRGALDGLERLSQKQSPLTYGVPKTLVAILSPRACGRPNDLLLCPLKQPYPLCKPICKPNRFKKHVSSFRFIAL